MKALLLTAALASPLSAGAAAVDFDADTFRQPPAGMTCGATGKGTPKWSVEGGRRMTLKYVDAAVLRAAWHTLRVEFAGSRIMVLLNGKRTIELDDRRIAGPGKVGVWTKADSVTVFDDFAYDAAHP